jgi:hypothetical protein
MAWRLSGARVTAKLGAPVPLESRGQRFAVPRRVTVFLEGDNDRGHPDLRVECSMEDGQPLVREVHIVAKPEGRPVRDADLASLSLDKLALRAFLEHAMTLEENPAGGWVATPITDEATGWRAVGAIDSAQKQSRGPSMVELRRVAEIYQADTSGAPSAAVAAVLGYSPRTAHRRVKQAEEAGLLPKTTRGKRRA